GRPWRLGAENGLELSRRSFRAALAHLTAGGVQRGEDFPARDVALAGRGDHRRLLGKVAATPPAGRAARFHAIAAGRLFLHRAAGLQRRELLLAHRDHRLLLVLGRELRERRQVSLGEGRALPRAGLLLDLGGELQERQQPRNLALGLAGQGREVLLAVAAAV